MRRLNLKFNSILDLEDEDEMENFPGGEIKTK